MKSPTLLLVIVASTVSAMGQTPGGKVETGTFQINPYGTYVDITYSLTVDRESAVSVSCALLDQSGKPIAVGKHVQLVVPANEVVYGSVSAPVAKGSVPSKPSCRISDISKPIR